MFALPKRRLIACICDVRIQSNFTVKAYRIIQGALPEFLKCKIMMYICLHAYVGLFLGGVYTCGSTAPSLLHGSIQLDAGGGAAALEQGGRSQPKRGPTHEVLLSHRLGYNGLKILKLFSSHFCSACLVFCCEGYLNVMIKDMIKIIALTPTESQFSF